MSLPIHSRLSVCLNKLSRKDLELKDRLKQERELATLLQMLLEGKIRHALSFAGELGPLTQSILDPTLRLEGTADALLNHFRYRLAHVAMRAREWGLAHRLLERLLDGPSQVRLARLYMAVCESRLRQGPLDESEIMDLVSKLATNYSAPSGTPLDLAVQDPVTNMAELFLLLQNAPEHLLDALYEPFSHDPLQRQTTSGLTVLFHPLDGPPSEVELSEWLALRQLDDLQASGWLVVDATERLGVLGRGTPVGHPRGDLNREAMAACLQLLAKEAPHSLSLREMRDRFFKEAGPELIGTPGTQSDRGPDSPVPVPVERATTGFRLDTRVKVIVNANQRWKLKRPYAVIKSDCSRTWSQSLPRPQ